MWMSGLNWELSVNSPVQKKQKKPKTAGSPKHCIVVVREVQGLENNVHQLDCHGLALRLTRALVTFDTLQHTV